jgi:hypothetical protein
MFFFQPGSVLHSTSVVILVLGWPMCLLLTALYYAQCCWMMIHILQVCPHRKHYLGFQPHSGRKYQMLESQPTAFPAVAAFIRAFQKIEQKFYL